MNNNLFNMLEKEDKLDTVYPKNLLNFNTDLVGGKKSNENPGIELIICLIKKSL